MKGRHIALLFDFLAVALLTATGTLSLSAQTRRVATSPADVNGAYGEPNATEPEKRAETSVSLGSNANPGYVNQVVDFIAVVGSPLLIEPGGSMTFYSNGRELGTVALKGVDGFLMTTFSKPGTYKIRARYNGDETHKPSSAKMLQFIVPFAEAP
jgi:hypothetical protein